MGKSIHCSLKILLWDGLLCEAWGAILIWLDIVFKIIKELKFLVVAACQLVISYILGTEFFVYIVVKLQTEINWHCY